MENSLYFSRRVTTFSALSMNKEGAEDVWRQWLGHPFNHNFDLFPSIVLGIRIFRFLILVFKLNSVLMFFQATDNKSDT